MTFRQRRGQAEAQSDDPSAKEIEIGRARMAEMVLDEITRFVWVDLEENPPAEIVDMAVIINAGAFSADDAVGKKAYRMGRSASQQLAKHIAKAIFTAIGLAPKP